MKKSIVFAALAWAGAAFAGDYHLTSTLKCSECHTMHASRQHGLNGGAASADPGWGSGPAFPNDKLLIQTGVNATCLACHDNNAFAPDVYAANELGAFANNARSAGALNGAVGGGHAVGAYADYMGHTLASPASPPGFTGSWDPAAEGFHCGNCHSIHGAPYFRNLGGAKTGTTTQKAALTFQNIGPTYNALPPGAGARNAAGATDDVFVSVATRDYSTNNVQFRIGTGQMSKYCAVCHGDFHGAGNTVSTDGLHFIRHPTDGVGLGNTTHVPNPATDLRTQLVRPAYDNATGNTAAQASCLSCHKGHGNLRGFGVVYPSAVTGTAQANLEQGDAVVDAQGYYPIGNMCGVCHSDYQLPNGTP